MRAVFLFEFAEEAGGGVTGAEGAAVVVYKGAVRGLKPGEEAGKEGEEA